MTANELSLMGRNLEAACKAHKFQEDSRKDREKRAAQDAKDAAMIEARFAKFEETGEW